MTLVIAAREAVRPSPTAGPRTSLLPIQIDANVGLASSAFWTCVFPLRKRLVSVFVAGVAADVGSSEVAPGTATLFKICGAGAVRASQIVGRCAAVTVAPACV